jgi:hypothetical protein
MAIHLSITYMWPHGQRLFIISRLTKFNISQKCLLRLKNLLVQYIIVSPVVTEYNVIMKRFTM